MPRFTKAAVLVTIALAGIARADVAMPSMFGSDMVLQRDMALPVWGTASPGEAVSVSVGGQTARTIAGPQGRWQVHLKALSAGGPVTMVVSGRNTLRFTNVLIGDVWICGGQSNMGWNVNESMNKAKEIATANYPRIRLFRVPRAPADKPTKDFSARWIPCSPESIPKFTAVGYFFGRKLHKDLAVPIGLIHSNWGGTPIWSWMSWDLLTGDPQFKAVAAPAVRLKGLDGKRVEQGRAAFAAWRRACGKALGEGKGVSDLPSPPRPYSTADVLYAQRPSVLYNGMIYPLIGFGIKGVIWYQGESDVSRAKLYRRMLPAMIKSWRKKWNQGDFAFLIVQLANFHRVRPQPSASRWAMLREAQTMTARDVPGCGMACIIDLGEAKHIHPTNKQDVGKRLALVALARIYGKKVVYSGPVYESMSVEGGQVRVKFSHIAGGLTTRTSGPPNAPNLKTKGYKFTLGSGPVTGFAVAGADKKFVWAAGRIDGDTVILKADTVPHPVAVRYAWADNPACNLYNKAGLPALPFRTDNW